ncbi:hypothetical protein B4102_3556 [Heyndrickxia sporothermodurans]|uniref:ATPase AAA-type core domain-containing protein n=1 Tax=Heyndrickxia sporothermodurans TaxID=46224 RepID=A0A150KPI9_9BACI|nr:AAA family ATPase [Heyndrickxia sporothermodurans]KYC96150.1 hypothetical protein B4102_3556 [Heyndrickxia sporothermodurans]
MKHYEEIYIAGFRGLKNAKLSNLSEFNILVGNNNSGKTSALEALELFSNPFYQRNIFHVSRLRERLLGPSRVKLTILDSISWLFPKDSEIIKISAIQDGKKKIIEMGIKEEIVYETNKNITDEEFIQEELFDDYTHEEIKILDISVVYKTDEETIRKEEFQFNENNILSFKSSNAEPFIKSSLITPIDHRVKAYSVNELNDVIISGDRPKIISALQYFDPDIIGIEFLMPSSGQGSYHSFIPYINHSKLGLVPVNMFGDGLRKALTLASALINAQNGLLLIDELETGIHTSILGEFFQWLVNACKEFNIQLFATTHSLEAIDSILDATKKDLDKLTVYRLENRNNETYVKRFPGDTLYDIRYQLGQDVR